MKAFQRLAVMAMLVAAVFFIGTPARAESSEAGKYIESIANQALKIISDKAAKNQKQARLDKLFADNVDFPWVGRFVMGRFWREASDSQKAQYLKEYQKFLTLHYTSRFTEYTSGAFKVTGAKDDGDNEYTVSMEIQGEGNEQPVFVDYRIRREEGSFKIFDVIVEGVSMITTQRSEFGAVLANHGIDYLIGQLEEKSKTGDLNLGGKS